MTAFGEEKKENPKKYHKVEDLVNDCNQHSDKEIQISENSYKIDYLNKAKDHANGTQNSHDISWLFIDKVKHSKPIEEDHSSDFKEIPNVLKIIQTV